MKKADVNDVRKAVYHYRGSRVVVRDNKGRHRYDVNEGIKSCHVQLDLTGVGMVDDKQSIDRPFVRTEVDLRVRKMVQVIGKSSLPRRQIVADLGLRQQSRRNFIYNYLKPAVAQGYVTMSYPGAPNKPEQTYRLTEKGLDLYKKVMGE